MQMSRINAVHLQVNSSSPMLVSITSFGVTPPQTSVGGSYSHTGVFQVNSGLTLAIHDPTADSLSAVLDAVANASRYVTISSLNDAHFSLSPQLYARTSASAKARAVQDAKSTAQGYAEVCYATLPCAGQSLLQLNKPDVLRHDITF